MQVIRDASDLERVPTAEVRRLIDLRIREAGEYVEHFSQLVFFVVIEPGDGVRAADEQLGFSLERNRFNDVPMGHPDFSPSWDVIEEHEGCFELVFVLSDDGSGAVVFVMKGEGASPELLDMCRRFTTEGARL